jgi:spectinomycin phosphotransferase
VRSSGLGGNLLGRLPVETFSLPSAALVHRLLTLVGETNFESIVAARFAAFWREHAGTIDRMISRAEALGAALRSKPFEHVLCHADIHAANILVDGAGAIRLID